MLPAKTHLKRNNRGWAKRGFGLVIALSVCGASFVPGGSLFAQPAIPPRLPLEVAIEKEPIHTVDPYFRAYVTDQSGKRPANKFTFVIPLGYQLQSGSSSNRVVLANRDGDCTITFSVLNAFPAPDAGLSIAACHTIAASNAPGAVFFNDAPCNLAYDKGRAMDLEWRTASDIVLCKHAVFLASSAGLLEFSVTTGKTGFREGRSSLDYLVKSFRYSTDGMLRFTPLSDRL
jgi:hypothetical protein